MSSEAQREQDVELIRAVTGGDDTIALEAFDALLAEVARLEQERDAEAELFNGAQAALAVARKREQRLRVKIDSACEALGDEEAAFIRATLAEPGRGECKPPATVGEECSPVTADAMAAAPGSASAAADEPGETP